MGPDRFVIYCCFHLNRRKNELLFEHEKTKKGLTSYKVSAIGMPGYGITCDFEFKAYQYYTPKKNKDCKTLNQALYKLKDTLDSNLDLIQYWD